LKELTLREIDSAASMLARAFDGDPLMNAFFSRSPIPPDEARFELFRYSCLIRLYLDWPLIGLVEGSHIRGVTCVSYPGTPDRPEEIERIYEHLKSRLGPASVQMLDQYAQIVDEHRPEESHHFLAVLGVDPDHHGRGFGGILLEEVHRQAALHPDSDGVALDTENPKNLSFYRRFGYELTAESDLAGIKIYHFFRPAALDR
jgi:GNAT superfamily N-acetyltransferase